MLIRTTYLEVRLSSTVNSWPDQNDMKSLERSHEKSKGLLYIRLCGRRGCKRWLSKSQSSEISTKGISLSVLSTSISGDVEPIAELVGGIRWRSMWYNVVLTRRLNCGGSLEPLRSKHLRSTVDKSKESSVSDALFRSHVSRYRNHCLFCLFSSFRAARLRKNYQLSNEPYRGTSNFIP